MKLRTTKPVSTMFGSLPVGTLVELPENLVGQRWYDWAVSEGKRYFEPEEVVAVEYGESTTSTLDVAAEEEREAALQALGEGEDDRNDQDGGDDEAE